MKMVLYFKSKWNGGPNTVSSEVMRLEGDCLVYFVTSTYDRKKQTTPNDTSKMVRTVHVVSGWPRTSSIIRRKIGTGIVDYLDGPCKQVIWRLRWQKNNVLMSTWSFVRSGVVPTGPLPLLNEMKKRDMFKTQNRQQHEICPQQNRWNAYSCIEIMALQPPQ